MAKLHASRSSSIVPNVALSKILDVLVSGLSAEADAISSDLESDEQDAITHHKKMLEMYGFLLQWTISVVEIKAVETNTTAASARTKAGKGSKAKANAKDGVWDSGQQIIMALDTMCKVLKLKLGRIFLTTSDRDTVVGLFTRSVYLIFESEQRLKNTAIKMHAFKVLCIAVKHHGHAFGIFILPISRTLLMRHKGHKPRSYRTCHILSICPSQWQNSCTSLQNNMIILN